MIESGIKLKIVIKVNAAIVFLKFEAAFINYNVPVPTLNCRSRFNDTISFS